MNKFFLAVCIALNTFCFSASAQNSNGKKDIAVIAYYAGRSDKLDSFAVEKLTHLIFVSVI